MKVRVTELQCIYALLILGGGIEQIPGPTTWFCPGVICALRVTVTTGVILTDVPVFSQAAIGNITLLRVVRNSHLVLVHLHLRVLMVISLPTVMGL